MNEQKFTVRKRRRREGKTDYHKRIRLLLSKEPRLVVRKSVDNIIAQIIEYQPNGDRIIASAHSNNLAKMGWKFKKNNIPASYLIGMLIAKKAKEKKCNAAILDSGLYSSIKGSKIYAVVKGAADNGLGISHSPEALPDENKIKGSHIVDYAKKVKAQGSMQFSKFDADNFSKTFEDIKNKLKAK